MSEGNTKWIVKQENGQIRGPFTTEEVLKFIRESLYFGTEMIAKYPDGNWSAVSNRPEFYEALLQALEGSAGEKPQLSPLKPGPDEETRPYEGSQIEQGDDRKKPSSDELETQIMAPPDSSDRKRRDLEVVKKLLESEKGVSQSALELNPDSPPISLTKKASIPFDPSGSRVKRLRDESAQTTLETVPVENIKPRKSKPLVFLSLIGALVIGFLFLPENKTELRISLLIPQVGRKPINESQLKEKLQLGLRAIEKDNFESIFEAQNTFVSLVEGAQQNLEVRGLLCYVYKELWPYVSQDAQDIRAVNLMSQATRALNVASPFGSYCESVKLFALGRFREAKGSIENLLESGAQFSLLPMVFQFKAELLEADKDYANSIPYFQKASEMWDTWSKPRLSLALAFIRTGNSVEASKHISFITKRYPDHKPARYLSAYLEFKLAQRPAEGLKILNQIVDSSGRVNTQIESETLVLAAEYLSSQGDKPRALKFAERAYSISPSNSLAKNLFIRLGGEEKAQSTATKHSEALFLGDQYARSGDCLSAQAEYKAAFELDVKNGTAAYKAAKCLWEINQSFEAIEWLKKAVKADPSLVSAYVLQADYLSRRFDFIGASQVLAEANRNSPGHYEVLRGMALLEFRKNNFLGAVTYGQRALKSFDGDIDTFVVLSRANRLLALSLTGPKDSEKREAATKDCIRFATRAVEIDSTNSEAQIVYAEMLAATNGIDSGLNYLRELIKKYSFSSEYRLALADIMKSEERYAQAREIYEQVNMVEPRNKKALVGMGHSYKALGMNEKALKSFLNAALVDPSDAEPLFLAGKIYQETQRFEEATNQFLRVIKINSNYPRTRYNLGRTYFSMGNLEGAINEIKQEKSQNPNIADSYILAAEVFLAKRQYSECAAEYSAAIKLRPQGAEIYVKAAACYRLSGNLDVAESMLSLAKTQENGYAEIYRELGQIMRTKGDPSAAASAFEMYLELAPNAPDFNEVKNLIQRLGGE